ncbi:hypothetical protein [Hyphomicrobium sp. 2TAF46]|uniref:hypothetical protein n=1 Tax=Hyphomicrobium sp. 2TAF46 TaxID=3233019 RepID=UPI003F8E7FA4
MSLGPDSLNADCTCITLDRAALNNALETEIGDPSFFQKLALTHPTLISNVPVFLRYEHAARMAEIIGAIETIAKLEPYREAALQSAPAISQFNLGPVGVFMGYDFHLGGDGPKLIEINTNAGGALINAFLARAQKACCPAVENVFPGQFGDHAADAIFMEDFYGEWRRQRGDQPLAMIAIVDREPEAQYLYPEFLLFQRLFQRHGIGCVITSPAALEHRGGRLWLGAQTIDLVYNRSTDFSFKDEDHATLRSAYLAGDAVVTPNPWTHALFADKRNLVRLTEVNTLENWGVSRQLIEIVAKGIPKTVLVTRNRGEELWAWRNHLFFKPASGFGSKAAYRGDKLTRQVWQNILDGTYVAQELVKPSARTVVFDGQHQVMKVDVRCYTYDGNVRIVAARLYQGQTTNFRTPGGGFAPVLWQQTGSSHPLGCSSSADPRHCG